MTSLLNIQQKLLLTKNSDFANSSNDLVELLTIRAQQNSNQVAYRFLGDGEFESDLITYGQLNKKAQAIAAHLQNNKAEKGDRALLLYPSGLEFIAAFLGCLYAGVIAVPTSMPRRREKADRLKAITENCQPKFILCTSAYLPNLKLKIPDNNQIEPIIWIESDSVWLELASKWEKTEIDRDAIAFLQYTSGSTGTPKGVAISHRNILYNQKMIEAGFSHSKKTVFVGWLPLFHDMGLIGNVLQPLYLGIPCILMPPTTFLVKPIRWLKAISKYKATTSGGPNFAYELISQIPTEQLANIDLSSWDLAFCGAEPIRAATIRKLDKFKSLGFDSKSFYPCYGMAETTLFVTGINKSSPSTILNLDLDSLARDRAVLVRSNEDFNQSNSIEIVGCGHTWLNQEIIIINPASFQKCLSGEIGEIWVRGDNVAQGYWNDRAKTIQTFKAYTFSDRSGSFLRTGDLGFFHNDELFITGRLKDLIILRGCNYYPQDIEATVEQSHPSLRKNAVAVFLVELEGKKQLIAVSEVARTFRRNLNPEEVVRAIRTEVSCEHNLFVDWVCLIRTGSIPKTSSGKIKRQACKHEFLNKTLITIDSTIDS